MSAIRRSSWKLCFFPLTFKTEMRVTSLPLPKVVGMRILHVLILYATNLATSKELPPPRPTTYENVKFLKSEIISSAVLIEGFDSTLSKI